MLVNAEFVLGSFSLLSIFLIFDFFYSKEQKKCHHPNVCTLYLQTQKFLRRKTMKCQHYQQEKSTQSTLTPTERTKTHLYVFIVAAIFFACFFFLVECLQELSLAVRFSILIVKKKKL